MKKSRYFPWLIHICIPGVQNSAWHTVALKKHPLNELMVQYKHGSGRYLPPLNSAKLKYTALQWEELLPLNPAANRLKAIQIYHTLLGTYWR